MAENPYDTLGVERDASPEEIKRAYRKRAAATHPDHGGDQEEFQRINAANIILSDPEKRAKYDRGEPTESEPDPVAGILVQTWSKVIQHYINRFRHIDIIDAMRNQLRTDIRSGEQATENMRKGLSNLTAMGERLTFGGSGGDFLRSHIESEKIKLEDGIRTNEATKDAFQRALDRLTDYGWTVDEDTPAAADWAFATPGELRWTVS